MVRYPALISALLLLASCGASEQNSPESTGKADNLEQITIRIDSSCSTVVSDPLSVKNVQLDGEELIVAVGYGGGCTKHEIGACWDGGFLESFPVQARLRLIHNANNDRCEALVGQTLRIDLATLANAYRSAYQSESGSILVSVDSSEHVTYTFGGARLAAAELKQAFAEAAKGAIYISEGDYAAEFLSGALSSDQAVSVETVKEALGASLVAFYEKEQSNLALADMAFEAYSTEESAQLLAELATANADDDEYYRESAAAFARIKALFDANLTDQRAMKIGPKAEDGTLAVDQGLYLWLHIGKTVDGQLAGFLVGSVET